MSPDLPDEGAHARPLTVVHVIDNLDLGGAQRVAADLVCGLDPERFDPRVVSLFPSTGSTLERRLARAGIPIQHLDKALGPDARIFPRLWRALDGADVVHTHGYQLAYALPTVWFRRLPTLHTVHVVADREIPSRARALFWLAFRTGVQPVAVAQEVARTVHTAYQISDIEVIPNGIDVDTFATPSVDRHAWRSQVGIPDDAVLFTQIGRLHSQKNPLGLVDAFAALEHERAHLAFAGTGPLQDATAQWVAHLGLEDRVHFLGLRDDIPDVLHASDVIVLGSHYEGRPLAILEAMAAGRPVVARPVGGLPDLIDSGVDGLLTEPGDPTSLTRCMHRVATSPGLREALGDAGARRARDAFALEVMVRRYATLYQRLARPR